MSFLETLSNTECPICLLPLWPEEYLARHDRISSQHPINSEGINDVDYINKTDGRDDSVVSVQQQAPGAVGSGAARTSSPLTRNGAWSSPSPSPSPSPVTIAAGVQQEIESSSKGGNTATGVCDYASCKDADAVVVLSCGHLLHSTCAMQLIEYKRNETNPPPRAGAATRAQPAQTNYFQMADAELHRMLEAAISSAHSTSGSTPTSTINSMHSALQSFFNISAPPPSNDPGFSCPVCRGRALSSSEELVVLNPKTISANVFQSNGRAKKNEEEEEGRKGDLQSDDVQCLDPPTSNPRRTKTDRKRTREDEDDHGGEERHSSSEDEREGDGADGDVHVVGTRHTGREKVYPNRLQRYAKKLYGKYKNIQNRNNVLAKTVERLQQEFASLDNTRMAATHVLEVLTAPSSTEISASNAVRGYNNTVHDRIARLQELRNAAHEAQSLLAAETENQAELLRESSRLDEQIQETRNKLRRLEQPKRKPR